MSSSICGGYFGSYNLVVFNCVDFELFGFAGAFWSLVGLAAGARIARNSSDKLR